MRLARMNAGFATEDKAVQIYLLQETSLVVCASEVVVGFRRHSDILSSESYVYGTINNVPGDTNKNSTHVPSI